MFCAVLAFWTHIRSFTPEIHSVEKYMDHGLLNACTIADSSRVHDIWMSGKTANYYYLGQYITAYANSLAGTRTEYGYNMMVCTITAIVFVSAFSITKMLIGKIQPDGKAGARKRSAGTAACILSAIGMNAGSNLHYPLYAWIMSRLPGSETSYYYPSTRTYIGDWTETDHIIQEFPSYSAILGDLHAHYCGLVPALLLVAVLIAWARGTAEERRTEKLSMLFLDIRFVAAALIAGTMVSINTWDFAIYYGLAACIVYVTLMKPGRFKPLQGIGVTLLLGAEALVLSFAVALPFLAGFEMISSEIRPVQQGSDPVRFLVVWGLPLLMTCIFLVYILIRWIVQQEASATSRKRAGSRKKKKRRTAGNVAGHAAAGNGKAAGMPDSGPLRWDNMKVPIIAMILVYAVILIYIPEVIYFKDIYPTAPRANTMFKFTYQAYSLFAMALPAAGYLIVTEKVREAKGYGGRKVPGRAAIDAVLGTATFLCCALYLCTCTYPLNAFKSKGVDMLDLTNENGARTLDGMAFMDQHAITMSDGSYQTLESDRKAIDWLRETVKDPGTVVLEADGLSYQENGRISAFTGLPTVIGWHTHEHLWRSADKDAVDGYLPDIDVRENDVETIYTTDDRDTAIQLIKKYDVGYIVVGAVERSKVNDGSSRSWDSPINEEMLKSLGDTVHFDSISSENSTYIIDVRNVSGSGSDSGGSSGIGIGDQGVG